ncbi:MAG: hypothetical protein ABI614_14625 [Planctomycetota bacterium]
MSNQTNASAGATLVRQATIVTFVLLCVMHQASQPGGGVAAEPKPKALASELVSRLGHEEFAERERAAADLIALELDASAALKIGTKSQDREIRHRSAKLLALIAEIDLERRFERFKNDTDPDSDYGLPAWDAYREVVGDSPGARSLFVSMHEDESRLLGQVQDNPKQLGDALAIRCDQLRGQAMFERIPIRLGTTATLLFVSTRDDVEATPLVHSFVYAVCSGSGFQAAIESGPLQESLVTLTERWIARQPASGISEALDVGLANGLKGCLPRAREVFASPVATISDRIYACLCVARFGDESDFSRLEAYLADVNICAKAQVGGQVVDTELRDIALAGLVRLAKLEPKDFGFDRLAFDRKRFFELSSLGFPDEQSRVQAIALWREYRRSKTEAKAP